MADIIYEIIYNLIHTKNIDNLIFDRKFYEIVNVLEELKKDYTKEEFQIIKKFIRYRAKYFAKYEPTEYKQLKSHMKKL